MTEYAKILEKISEGNANTLKKINEINVETLEKIGEASTDIKLAKNEIKHIAGQLHTHVESNERHKDDYYKWRRKVDLDREKAITECPVETKVVEIDKEKISRKSAYRTAGFVILVVGVIEGVIQFFKGE